MRDRHAKFEDDGKTLRFEFKGKSGIKHTVKLSDRRLARVVKQCQDIPGQELFQYLDEEGQRHAIESSDVNEYLREISGGDFTAKDFRTWAGTLQAVEALEPLGPAATQREAKAAILQTIDRVAQRLNNTRAVCRKYYVHPAVLETYTRGTLHEALQNGGPPKSAASALRPEEQAVVRLLRHVA
jgi:DNA topoisomerase I